MSRTTVTPRLHLARELLDLRKKGKDQRGLYWLWPAKSLRCPHRSPPIPLDHLKDSSKGISGDRGGGGGEREPAESLPFTWPSLVVG
jgi:hypothetical protein